MASPLKSGSSHSSVLLFKPNHPSICPGIHLSKTSSPQRLHLPSLFLTFLLSQCKWLMSWASFRLPSSFLPRDLKGLGWHWQYWHHAVRKKAHYPNGLADWLHLVSDLSSQLHLSTLHHLLASFPSKTSLNLHSSASSFPELHASLLADSLVSYSVKETKIIRRACSQLPVPKPTEVSISPFLPSVSKDEVFPHAVQISSLLLCAWS